MFAEKGFQPVNEKNIRSKERVKDLAEVFTAEREVKAMMDLVGDVTHVIETTFLEPSCGNGNFLVEILARKMATVFGRHKRQPDVEKALLRSLMSIYAVDICSENVSEAQTRLWNRVTDAWSDRMNTRKMTPEFRLACRAILRRNILVADFLKGRNECIMIEYVGPIAGKYVLKHFSLGNPSETLESEGSFTVAELPKALAMKNLI